MPLHATLHFCNLVLVGSFFLATAWQNQQNDLCAQWKINLGIHPVWSESSLFVWRSIGSLVTHWAHSEDWSDWAAAQAGLSLHWVHRLFCWFCHAPAHFRHMKLLCLSLCGFHLTGDERQLCIGGCYNVSYTCHKNPKILNTRKK